MMDKVATFTVSLPTEILEGVDHERAVKGESRDEFILRALEQCLRRRLEEREADEQYVRGYRDMPETDDYWNDDWAKDRPE